MKSFTDGQLTVRHVYDYEDMLVVIKIVRNKSGRVVYGSVKLQKGCRPEHAMVNNKWRTTHMVEMSREDVAMDIADLCSYFPAGAFLLTLAMGESTYVRSVQTDGDRRQRRENAETPERPGVTKHTPATTTGTSAGAEPSAETGQSKVRGTGSRPRPGSHDNGTKPDLNPKRSNETSKKDRTSGGHLKQ